LGPKKVPSALVKEVVTSTAPNTMNHRVWSHPRLQTI
jgi:hypothetical protein